MSHYFKQPMPEMGDPDALVAGLKWAGIPAEAIEQHAQAVPLVNYSGKQLGQMAHVVVRRQAIGSWSNDTGFEWVDGKVTMHQCDYARDQYGQDAAWLGKVRQGYQLAMAEREARRQRKSFHVVEQTDGSLRVTVGGY